MSRSVKKNPILKDSGNGKKEDKRLANKRVRNVAKQDADLIDSGGGYKKHYCSWLITDFVARFTEQDAIEYYEAQCRPEYYSSRYCDEKRCQELAEKFKKRYPTVEKFLNWWKKKYLRK